MIYDKYSCHELYTKYSDELQMIWDYYEKEDWRSLPNDQTVMIKGKDVMVKRQEYDTAPDEERFYETHKEYISIMVMEEGKEIIGIVPKERLGKITIPYGNTDVQFYDSAAGDTIVQMHPGEYIVIMVDEGHKTQVTIGDKPSHVIKFIGKIRAK